MSLRGYNVSHQKLVLAVNLNGSITATAELTLIPALKELRTIYLNCRQCKITSVKLLETSESLEFTHNDLLNATAQTFIPTNEDDLASAYPELKRKLYTAINESEGGELIVRLPAEAIKETPSSTQNGDAATPSAQPAENVSFDPFTLVIDYELENPRDGIRFAGQDSADLPHVYTHTSTSDAARCWMPCIDSLWERCTWKVQIICPRNIKIVLETETNKQKDVLEELPILAIASAELMEQVAHPEDPSLCIWHYQQSVPTSAQHMGFAIGPFHIQDLSSLSMEDTPLTEDGKAKMHAFCLPGYEAELENSTSFMRQALDYLTTEFGSYPFTSYKMVFIDDPDFSLGTSAVHNTATMTTYTSDLLYPAQIIEQGLETRQALCYGLASQWSGISIIQKTYADTWLVHGIALRLTSLALRDLLGMNDYRYKLKKDVQRCCDLDVLMPPLCEPSIDHPPQNDILSFINLKAPLVLYILDQRLLKSGTNHGLSRVLPKIFLSAISGELRDSLLSTHTFLRICKKVSGVDLRPFAEQWIYSSGCPIFKVTATFSRKKMAVEMQLDQVVESWQASCNLPWPQVGHINPLQYFQGQMTIRVHEADGTPYEHVLDIREASKRHDVPFNTKYKRIRRQTKRYQARAEALKSGAVQVQGQQEAEEELQLIDMAYGLDIWEDDQSKKDWRLAECDWNEEEEAMMAAATYEWIRLDADFDWIAKFEFEQPHFMWVSQLSRDRDVIAQMEAVEAMEKLDNKVVSSALAKTVLTTNYYYGIRVAATLALARTCTAALNHIGLFFLFKIYQTRYCYAPASFSTNPFTMQLSTKPNNFSDFSEYFVRLAVIAAVASIRDENGQPLVYVIRFLIRLLTLNDNSINPFSDTAYIATLFQALGYSFISVKPPKEGQTNEEMLAILQHQDVMDSLVATAWDEVTRYVNLDRLVPSYRNIITLAGLEWKFKMMFSGNIPVDLKLFFAYSREDNYLPVRLTALEALLLLKGSKDLTLLQYILSVLRCDKSSQVRRRLAEAIMTSLPILSAVDDFGKVKAPENTLTFFEEDASTLTALAPVKNSSENANRFNIKESVDNLRKEYVNGSAIMNELLNLLKNPEVDLETRFCAFKICEILFQPAEEPLPKLKLRMALPTPAPVAPVEPEGQMPRLRLLSAATYEPEPAYDDAFDNAYVDIPYEPFPLRPIPAASRRSNIQPRRDSTGKKKIKQKEKKPKKPKQLKSQISGMSLDDVKACRNCLNKVLNDKSAEMFRYPVDPARDNAPGYLDVVTRPMDLMTIQASLESGNYSSRRQFKADIDQIVINAHLYNGHKSAIGALATKFQIKFDKWWNRIEQTISATQEKRSKSSIQVPTYQYPPSSTLDDDDVVPRRPSLNLKLKLSAPASASESAVVHLPDQIEALPTSSATGSPSNSLTASLPSAIRPTLKLSFGRSKTAKKVTIQEDPLPNSDDSQAVKTLTEQDATVSLGLPLPSVSVSPPSPSVPTFSSSNQDGTQLVPSSVVHQTSEEPSSNTAPQAGITRSASPELERSDRLLAISEQQPERATSVPLDSSQDQPSFSSPERTADLNGSNVHSPSLPAPSPPALQNEVSAAEAVPAPQPSSHPMPKFKVVLKPLKPASFNQNPPIKQETSNYEASPSSSGEASVNARAQSETLIANGVENGTGYSSQSSLDRRKAKQILTEVYNIDEAGWFRTPVDVVLSGCPTYYDEIKHPMDLTTIWNKLERGEYFTFEQMNADMELIVANCHQFNPPGSLPVQYVDTMMNRWKAEWSGTTLPRDRLTTAEKKGMQSMLRQLTKDDLMVTGGIFQVPVDPIALGIPHYFDVIPREEARDLKTIKSKLDSDAYRSLQDFEADFQLMLDNALKFNLPGDPIYNATLAYQEVLRKAIKTFTPAGVKRSNTSTSASANKRSKLY